MGPAAAAVTMDNFEFAAQCRFAPTTAASPPPGGCRSRGGEPQPRLPLWKEDARELPMHVVPGPLQGGQHVASHAIADGVSAVELEPSPVAGTVAVQQEAAGTLSCSGAPPSSACHWILQAPSEQPSTVVT